MNDTAVEEDDDELLELLELLVNDTAVEEDDDSSSASKLFI